MNIKSKTLVLTLLMPALVFAQTTQTTTPPNAEIEIVDTTVEPTNASQNASEVQIDEAELPGESVIPKTDLNAAVLNKNLTLAKRIAIDLSAGNILDEPLLNANYFLIRASYFTTDEISYGLGLKSRFGGQTSYSEQLNSGSAQLEFERAPQPKQSLFLSMGYHFYYGKVSLSKNSVITATTKLDTDLGMQTIGTSQKPFIQAAVTQSFFMNKNISLGLSYGLSLAQIYDPTSVNIRSTQALPAESDFAQKIRLNQYLSLNLGAIF